MLKYAYRALYPSRVTSRSSVRLVSGSLYRNSAWSHRPIIRFNTDVSFLGHFISVGM